MSQIYDVVILGSGSAALSAALKAAQGGLKTLVLEKSSYLGGTSAMSGAGMWVPARKAGITDTTDDIVTYLRSASPPHWQETEDGLWQAFAEASPRMLRFVEDFTRLRFKLVAEPDPFSELPGGKVSGRMLTPKALSRRLLGPYARRLRRSTLVHLFDYQEMVNHDPYHHPIRAGLVLFPRLAWRWLTASGGQGTALIVGLLRGCIDMGCEIRLNARAEQLLQDETERVRGVKVNAFGFEERIGARHAVVIATGGFEWNRELRESHFPGVPGRIGSPRTNEGDGQIMAAHAGARLERMDQANIYPCLPTRYEGQPHGLPITFQAEPHSILVNGDGRRFVSENDFNVGEAIDQRDSESGLPINLPVWLVGDARFLRQSLPFHWYASYERGWVKKARSIEELAKKIGLSPPALRQTVDRFNDFCRDGHDADFGRGKTAWEGYKSHGAKALFPVLQAPFVAMSVGRSILGTKGGARTNRYGQVLSKSDEPIAGLYAAGLAMANPIGTRALGPGTTIGPNMTWGFICAETILREAGREN